MVEGREKEKKEKGLFLLSGSEEFNFESEMVLPKTVESQINYSHSSSAVGSGICKKKKNFKFTSRSSIW